MYKTSSNHQISLGGEFNKEGCTQICNDRYQCRDSCHNLHQCCILYNICKVIDNCTGLNYKTSEEPYNIQCKKFPRFVVEQAGNICFQAYFSCFIVTRSFVLKKQKKNTRQPITPKIIITIRNPSASFPFPNLSTSVRANALTTVDPIEEKKVLHDARTVLS